MFAPEQDLGHVPHDDLDLALDLEDPEHALPHPPLPRGPRLLPRAAPGLRASRDWSLPCPPPRELLIYIR